MTQHRHIANNRLDPQVKQLLRLLLRSMGLFALATCLFFWLSLLLQ